MEFLDAGSYQPLVEACHSIAKLDTADAVLLAAADVPHAAHLPHCCAVMHHGGAGTTSAALAAGCPQLVCPLHFDQFQWVSEGLMP
jgi:UDP:flavonoid glycosyltransferase YjiC (YdhE family)